VVKGALTRVWWESPAYKAGLVPGMRLLAVNGEVYSADKLRDAIVKAEKDTEAIHLVVKDRDLVKTIDVNYHGGLRYPHLARVEGTPDRLDAILAAVK
jgi:predicted metalloprotease with PDZ domain